MSGPTSQMTPLARAGERVNNHQVFQPTIEQADVLIEKAGQHALGMDYLQNGALDSVAATFRVHAFTVELARQRCRQAR